MEIAASLWTFGRYVGSARQYGTCRCFLVLPFRRELRLSCGFCGVHIGKATPSGHFFGLLSSLQLPDTLHFLKDSKMVLGFIHGFRMSWFILELSQSFCTAWDLSAPTLSCLDSGAYLFPRRMPTFCVGLFSAHIRCRITQTSGTTHLPVLFGYIHHIFL